VYLLESTGTKNTRYFKMAELNTKENEKYIEHKQPKSANQMLQMLWCERQSF
jgi:hypothetical protein